MRTANSLSRDCLPRLRISSFFRKGHVMAARAMWKGQLKVGTTKIPVKLYSAVQDQTVRFHILDDKHKARVKQHMVDPDSGDEVPNDEIQKGYEIEPGRFVILAPEDLEALQPPPS